MVRTALLAALVLAGCGDATPEAPVVSTDETTVVVPNEGTPEAISAVEAGEDAGVVAAAEAGEDTAPISAVEAGEEAAPLSETKTGGSTQAAGTDRPETKTRSVSVEGEASTETLRLATFPSFPVPFSTYLRPGIVVNQPGSGDALSIEQGPARILVTVPYESVDAASARLRAALSGARDLDQTGAWVRDGFYLYQGTNVTTIRIGEHNGTTFVIEESMPAEMGDGFAPTVQVLLDEWVWADGSSL